MSSTIAMLLLVSPMYGRSSVEQAVYDYVKRVSQIVTPLGL